MKNRWMISSLVTGAIALLILGGYATQQKAQAVNMNGAPAGNGWNKSIADQEEHQTYQIKAGAHIDVFNISGPVSVEAIDGSTAEVSIYRSAPNRDDLAYRKVSVEQTSSGLTITQKNDGTDRSAIDLLNRVVLKVPRQVSVTGKSISGSFNISGITGAIDLNGISGSVDVRHFNGVLTVSGVSGNVRVPVKRIDAAGLRVSGVSGNVYLGLASDLNAELSVENTTAGVSNKIQDLALINAGPSNYTARLGSGGPRIEVSNVTGFIVLQRI
jgi:putative adhesin